MWGALKMGNGDAVDEEWSGEDRGRMGTDEDGEDGGGWIVHSDRGLVPRKADEA